MGEKLLTTEQVAEILGVDERTILNYRTRKNNPLPCVKLPAVRFRREAVEKWIREREINGD